MPLGAPAAPPPYYAAPDSGPAPAKTLSIISLIVGILGLIISIFGGWGLILSIGAIVLGHLGQRRERVQGKPLWLTGLITGYVGVALSIVWLVVYVVIAVAVINSGGTVQDYRN